MSYTLTTSINLGPLNTSRTLHAQLIDIQGNPIGEPITTGFTEIGSGFYSWVYTGYPDQFRGGIKILYSSGGLAAFAAINPEEAENHDEPVSTRATAWQIGPPTVTVCVR